MSQGSIGKAALILSTQHGKLTSGLDKVYGRISGFKGRVAGLFAGGFAGLAGGKLFSDALDTAKSLSDQGRAAKAIGAGTAAYMGLGKAAERAGVPAEEFHQSLGKLQAKIGKASFGGDGAQALAQLGLRFEDLKGQSIDEQFYRITDAIAGVPDPAVRAGLATKLFEEQGLKLLPVLNQGSGALRQFVDQQRKLGTALDEKDMAKLSALRAAIPRAQAAFEGGWNKIVVAMAPILTGMANRLSRIFERAQPFLDAMVHGLEVFFKIADEALTEVGALIDEAWQATVRWFAPLTEGLDTYAAIEDLVYGVAKAAAKVGIYVWDWHEKMFAVGAAIVGAVLEPLDEVKGTLAEIWRWGMQIQTFGLMADDVNRMADNLKEADWAMAGRKMKTWAFDVMNGKNLNANLAGIDAWFDRVRKKKDQVVDGIQAGVPAAMDSANAALGRALEKGSKEEYSVRMKWEFGGGQSVAAQQLAEQRKANGIAVATKTVIEKIAAAPAKLGVL